MHALLVLAREAWEADAEEERIRLAKKNILHGISITDAPCRRCGSPVASQWVGDNDKVVGANYWCGSTLRLGSNGLFEFDALCRNAAKPKELPPVVHIVADHETGDDAIRKLGESGYIVIVTGPTAKVNMLRPESDLASAEEIGMAALEAMQGPTNDSVRAKFAEILFKKLSARTKP